ncbi:MAG: CDP-diacylglycerol--glycerol-3-phosphate 3-phosphatidyltransferase [Pseudomonadota bacterium]
MEYVPNTLTSFRLVSPFLILSAFFLLARPFGLWLALALFVFAALTDFLDGFLARRYDLQSEFGRVFDPIADKVLVLVTGFGLLAAQLAASGVLNVYLVIPFALILFRELFVSGLREGLAGTVTVPVTWAGKTKTAVQLLAIACLFALPILGNRLSDLVQGMDDSTIAGILNGAIEDVIGLKAAVARIEHAEILAIILFWVAAILSWVSGAQYVQSAAPHLRRKDT